MFQTKSMLFAVVALMVVGSAIAIIGGKDAVRGKFPYFAYLKCYQIKPNFSWKSPYKYHTCGGALISNQWVLTAAHCLLNTDGAEVLLDVGNLNDTNEIGRETFNVTKRDFLIYPKYKITQPFVDDIGLIKLPSILPFLEYIRAAQFSCSPTPVGTDAITMGFGRVSKTDRIFATSLQYTKLKTIDLEECVSNTENLTSKNSVVCANGPHTSICRGDKGSPLVAIKTGKLIGIASYADRNCTLGSAITFTGITPYIQWIEGNIDELICKKQIAH